jgi:hypothetical protein
MKLESNYGERTFPQMERLFGGGADGTRLLSAVESSARKLESLSTLPDSAVSQPARAALRAYSHLARLIDELRETAGKAAASAGGRKG